MRSPDLPRCVAGVLAGERVWVARAVTLVESIRADHREPAQRLLAELTPHAGGATRVGITGVPGVGKSTFIETLGTDLTAAGHRVAVLAVDPSSQRTGGSVLGDRTRMRRLAADPAALVRPSPSAGTLGGVTRATREAIVVVEAAGYDVVLVETVGVGQSETAVAAMVDTVLLLVLPGAGDDLQGVKRGILELADVIAVTKADGARVAAAGQAVAELSGAVRLLHPPVAPWRPPVLACSARTNTGVRQVWEATVRHRAVLDAAGTIDSHRRDQQLEWLWSLAHDRLMTELRADPRVRRLARELQQRLLAGECTAAAAAEQMVGEFRGAVPPAGPPPTS
ncbi:methylmalonyl Co-A mutase-associated GTPase MeaB [Actinoplanes sp. NPDC048967]|uniref:methylmalonyl Co-A mutase-associated GTPase MeaB n=1 Tax=Actinoplanes sp. NPDC048967 TaxID=3155269 RepID=UPI00340F00B2